MSGSMIEKLVLGSWFSGGPGCKVFVAFESRPAFVLVNCCAVATQLGTGGAAFPIEVE